MANRDVLSIGNGTRGLRELLSSALVVLFLGDKSERPPYFSSPWMSDFPLFDNRRGQFASLFPQLAGDDDIYLSQYLARLAKLRPTRIITTHDGLSGNLLDKILLPGVDIRCRFAGSEYHEKGILASPIYFEGSMNITYSGVFFRSEKVTYHVADDAAGIRK